MVKGLFENKEVRVSVIKIVIDDDASTRALLTHSLAEFARRVVDFQWPVDAKGKKIPVGKDVGKLPFEHPVIVFLADLMHRIRSFGKYVFGLANAPKSTSTCTMVDAYWLKRNFGYWLLSYCKKDFDIFSNKSQAVVEHHFNNHSHCNEWCSMRKGADATTEAKGNLKYRCKTENSKLYDQIHDVVSRFTTPVKLRECHHRYSYQKNESMNKVISRYVPKDRTFCKSMSLSSRVCLAVGLDSVRHKEYYQRFFDETKSDMPENTRRMLVKMSNRKKYDGNYQAQPKRKRKRIEMKFGKMKEGLKKQMADKAMRLVYATRHSMGLDDEGVEQAENNPNTCIFCGVAGHKTRRAKICKYFGWRKADVEAEMVSVNVARATGIAVATATNTVSSQVVESEGTCYFFGSQYDCYNIQYCPYSFYMRFLRRGIRCL
jgi:hypothetical protein